MSFKNTPLSNSLECSVVSFKTRRLLSISLVLFALCVGLYLAPSTKAGQAKEYTAEQIVESAIVIAGNGFGRVALTQIRHNGIEVGKETRTSPDGRAQETRYE